MGSHAGGNRGNIGRRSFYDTELGRGFLESALATTLMSPAFRQLKDQQVVQDLKDTINQYAKEIGFTSPMIIDVGTLPKGRYAKVQGSHITLSRAVFNRKHSTVEGFFKERIAKGWVTETYKPVAKTIAHEFAHKTYYGLSSSGQSQVEALFKSFSAKGGAKGWGLYAKQDAKEFYADGIAKSLLGKSDKYTRALRAIK